MRDGGGPSASRRALAFAALLAGLIMKIAGGLILWGFIAAIFFRWHARERDGWDALALRQVERDVRASVLK